MNFYLIPAFGMLAFIAGGCATSIDMGTCSCVCGGSGSVISSSEPVRKSYQPANFLHSCVPSIV